MKSTKINYIQLYQYFIQKEELGIKATLRNILRVRKLPTDYKLAVSQILNGVIPNIECNKVTLHELIEEDDMKPVNAVMFMDWLRREPDEAFQYMQTNKFRSSIDPLGQDELDILDAAIEKLQSELGNIDEGDLFKEDHSKEDIETK